MKPLLALLTLALALSACDDGSEGGGGSTHKLGQYPDNHPCTSDFACAQGLVCSRFEMCAPIPCRFDDSECPLDVGGRERSCVQRFCRNECATDQQCVDYKPPFTKCENRVCTTPVTAPTPTNDTASSDED